MGGRGLSDTGVLHISQEHPDPTQAPTFSPGPQSPDFPPELPLQPLSPEGSELGFGDQCGGPSQRQIHRPLPSPGLNPRGSGGTGGEAASLSAETEHVIHARPQSSIQAKGTAATQGAVKSLSPNPVAHPAWAMSPALPHNCLSHSPLRSSGTGELLMRRTEAGRGRPKVTETADPWLLLPPLVSAAPRPGGQGPCCFLYKKHLMYHSLKRHETSGVV